MTISLYPTKKTFVMMETTQLKSVLKKSDESDFVKPKKVTFLNTVKVFIDSLDEKIKVDPKLQCLEISIDDKSSNAFTTEDIDDCKITDFLVHKVIYENYVLPENDELLETIDRTGCETFLFESEEEGLEFVVHKVTDHEDDLIKQELDLGCEEDEHNLPTEDDTIKEEDLPTEDNTINKVLLKEDNTKDENLATEEVASEHSIETTVSKLSVENILEHDKIIAFIDQAGLELSLLKNGSLLSSPERNVEITTKDSVILSPPLQELSLEKIVKAHSGNILSELDISPLNSVQETDSDSDLSSEGTMIMMTSEECKRNEEHIRKSLLQYESIRQKKAAEMNNFKSVNGYVSKLQAKSDEVCSLQCNSFQEDFESKEGKPLQAVNDASFSKVSRISRNTDSVEKCINNVSRSSLPDPVLLLGPSRPFYAAKNQISNSSDKNLFTVNEGFKCVHSSSLPNPEYMCGTSKPISPPKKLFSEHRLSYPLKNLTSTEIPSDVREWKIRTLEKHMKQSSETETSVDYISEFCANEGQKTLTKSVPNPDELESFVHESTERVERIRKRYHSTMRQHHSWTTHRSPICGVKPRFGSTAEIIQLMQKQNCPPLITFRGTRNHSSWPCDSGHKNQSYHGESSSQYSRISRSDCFSQSSFDSDDLLNSSSEHCSISSCPPIMMQERGLPEGCSPPRLPKESHSRENAYNDSSNNVVYYSMKV